MSLFSEPRLPASEAPTVQFAAVRVAAEPEPAGSARPSLPTQPGGSGQSGVPVPPGQFGPPRRPRRRRVLVAGGVAIVVALAAGGSAAFAYAGDIPRGTTVLGVDLGGMSRAEAATALRAALARESTRFGAPVPVRVGQQSAEVRPADVGLAVDVDATVKAAVASTVSPVGRLLDSRTVAPVVTIDVERLDAALRKSAGKALKAAKRPGIVFQGTTPTAVYPQPGTGLDAEQSAQAVRHGWLNWQPIEVPVVTVESATTAADVDRLIAEFAKPAVAGPVTVRTDRGRFDIPPTAIAKSLVFTAGKDGTLDPRVDEKKLRAALGDRMAAVEIEPKEATVALGGGKPRVVASTGGKQVDLAALSRDLLPVLPKRDGREVTGTLKTVEPKTTTADLTKLGIKERVSTFTTRFTGGLSSPRSQNIVRIAAEVDGAVVKPGETFSLNGHTGPRGYAQGYRDAPVIIGGKLEPGVGGGASQFTTTLFNASYYAGMEDVEHKPHSYWFSRYPPVVESTIFYPDLDFKFRNDTPYGVLIDTSHTSRSITVSFWSTKYYDSITTKWSARRNVTRPKTIFLTPGPKCIATDGLIGFSQDAFRIFRKGGKEIRREKFSWRYLPEPRFVCAKKPPSA